MLSSILRGHLEGRPQYPCHPSFPAVHPSPTTAQDSEGSLQIATIHSPYNFAGPQVVRRHNSQDHISPSMSDLSIGSCGERIQCCADCSTNHAANSMVPSSYIAEARSSDLGTQQLCFAPSYSPSCIGPFYPPHFHDPGVSHNPCFGSNHSDWQPHNLSLMSPARHHAGCLHCNAPTNSVPRHTLADLPKESPPFTSMTSNALQPQLSRLRSKRKRRLPPPKPSVSALRDLQRQYQMDSLKHNDGDCVSSL